ncbi:hypothetical protein GYMLUDRAFT_248411 [Collybiopsis luxurians FD-317 M1]|uniref:Uncharacterized protein n=1 Tax=Collybiopsis luxurians FD-317 M1 TaxID=944289 RepID=A0A0D0CKZ0_9AGAR|nr:hypothetical protein GYMLUDRAFT_248411 [Collybiopsis luxurians FD-317 M1]
MSTGLLIGSFIARIILLAQAAQSFRFKQPHGPAESPSALVSPSSDLRSEVGRVMIKRTGRTKAPLQFVELHMGHNALRQSIDNKSTALGHWLDGLCVSSGLLTVLPLITDSMLIGKRLKPVDVNTPKDRMERLMVHLERFCFSLCNIERELDLYWHNW